MTVLVVEDEVSVRLLVRRILEQHGHKAYTAANVQEALAILEALPGIEVILVEWDLPGAEGQALPRHLDTLGYTIPVAVMTGRFSGPPDLPVLNKPFSPDELLVHLEQALKRRANHQ